MKTPIKTFWDSPDLNPNKIIASAIINVAPAQEFRDGANRSELYAVDIQIKDKAIISSPIVTLENLKSRINCTSLELEGGQILMMQSN